MFPDELPRAPAAGRYDWPALRLTSAPVLEAPPALPAAVLTGWKPLIRHQRQDGPPSGRFNPGWARIGWTPSALVVDFAFTATGACNRARRLNERTYLLGDVGEIFLQWPGSDRYVEIHVTPENQRLQLAWRNEGLEAVRKGKAQLEDFAVADPGWVQSVAQAGPTLWSARTLVPAAVITPAGREFAADDGLLAAICRYDYSGGTPPVLSSTANFQGQPFHTREAWQRVRLLP